MRPSESLHHFDVKDVGYQEMEPYFSFSIEQDVSLKDREVLRREYRNLCQVRDWHGCARLAFYLPDIDPDFNFLSSVDDDGLESIRGQIQNSCAMEGWGDVVLDLWFLSRINPTCHLADMVTSAQIQHMRETVYKYWRGETIFSLTILRFLHEVDPRYHYAEARSDTDRTIIREAAEQYRKKGDWVNFALEVELLQEADPNIDITQVVSREDFQAIRVELPKLLLDNIIYKEYFAHLVIFLDRLSRQTTKSNAGQHPGTLPEVRKY